MRGGPCTMVSKFEHSYGKTLSIVTVPVRLSPDLDLNHGCGRACDSRLAYSVTLRVPRGSNSPQSPWRQ